MNEDPAVAIEALRRLATTAGAGIRPAAVQALLGLASEPAHRDAALAAFAVQVQAWPDKQQLASIIATAGWDGVRWKNLSGGIVAIHSGYKV